MSSFTGVPRMGKDWKDQRTMPPLVKIQKKSSMVVLGERMGFGVGKKRRKERDEGGKMVGDF